MRATYCVHTLPGAEPGGMTKDNQVGRAQGHDLDATSSAAEQAEAAAAASGVRRLGPGTATPAPLP